MIITRIEQQFNIDQRSKRSRINLRLSYQLENVGALGSGRPDYEQLIGEENYTIDIDFGNVKDEELGGGLEAETITPENHIQIWPFYYDAYVERTSERQVSYQHVAEITKIKKLKLTLILYRGVKVSSSKLRLLTKFIDLKIIRVQDIRQIPAFGTPIEHKNLFPVFNAVDLLEKYYDEDKSEKAIDRAKKDALENIIIQYVENGVRFQWLWTNQVLEIRIKNPKDAQSGFSFSVNPEANLSPRISKALMDSRSSIKAEDFNNISAYIDALDEFDKRNNIDIAPTKRIYHDLLHIKICGEVTGESPTLELKKSHLPQPIVDPTTIRKGRFLPEVNVVTKQENIRFYTIEKVDKLDELPVAAERFTCKAHDKTLKIEETGFKYEQIAIDFVLSSIPILGDLIDIGDFLLALKTNRDKYGDKVTTSDKVLMGIGALIPVFSSSTVKNLLKSSD